MPALRILPVLAYALMVSACATMTPQHAPTEDLGILWVKHSAEYRALAAQTYDEALNDLDGFMRDTRWDVVRDPVKPSALPPAVILDVDETVVSNVDFQLTFERPFENHKLDTWSSNYQSLPVPGAAAFINTARQMGVAVFFVTNRPCQPKVGNDDPCPQKQTTIDDIRQIGVDADADHVLLSGERAGWDKEKLSRRQYIAETHRVIMLLGDDLSDFIPCVREDPAGECTTAATRASRLDALDKHRQMWGNGWYILPNPMHGSWTSVR